MLLGGRAHRKSRGGRREKAAGKQRDVADFRTDLDSRGVLDLRRSFIRSYTVLSTLLLPFIDTGRGQGEHYIVSESEEKSK